MDVNLDDAQKALRKHDLLLPMVEHPFWCMCGVKSETRYAREKHVVTVILCALLPSIEETTAGYIERAVNSAYGTDDRHALLARGTAAAMVDSRPIPWDFGKHFGRG